MLKHNRVLIVGLGLIGGSLAAALRRSQFCQHVIGVSRKAATLEKAMQLGIVDEVSTDLKAVVPSADIIVLATPMSTYRSLFEQIKPYLGPETILTDVGSVKEPVINVAKAVFKELPPLLVPGHPIAGSEKSGVSASDATLFQHHLTLLTPLAHGSVEALEIVKKLWESVGSQVKLLEAEHHDSVLAATSHLPHLLAYSLVDTLAGVPENREIFEYAAGGFRDFTRIAASDPTMWHDIFFANRDPILQALDQFQDGLSHLKACIERGESEAILGIATRAKAAREHFSVVLAKRSYIGKPSASSEESDPVENSETEETNSHGNQSQTIEKLTSFGGANLRGSENSIKFIAKSAKKIRGTVRVPGDKSISHRAVMLGSIAQGVTEVSGWLEGEDALATLQAFRDMGVVIEGPTEGNLKIHGVGLHGLKPPPGPLYLGNSGTSMRLLAGLLAGQSFATTLTGDASLSKRPMRRVADPLQKMGAEIVTEEGGCPPVEIHPTVSPLTAIDFELPIASAQVKSCLLLAGLYAEGETVIEEPAPTRDHTERMFKGFGVETQREDLQQGRSRIRLRSGQVLKATEIDVPADISSAAFLMVAATIAEDSELLLKHVGINPTRIGVINILKEMGANIEIQNSREMGGEVAADILVKSSQLRGIHIPEDQVPLAIDEFPVIFIAAACAIGDTVLSGAEELRVKESDRIQAMAEGMALLGIDLETKPDGIVIKGCQGQSEVFSGGEVESHHDHRIAMSFAVASLRACDTIIINECDNVATSFPDFVSLVNGVGLNIEALTDSD